jgi:phage terminase small subunit
MAEAVIMSSKALNPKQEAFCNAYMLTFNGSKAAVTAGYSPSTAAATASRMLTKSNIIEALAERREIANQVAGVTQERVIKELARIGFADIRGVIDDDGGMRQPSEWSDATAATVSSVEISSAGDMVTLHKIRTYDKIQALDKLGKHLGLFGEDKDKSAPINIQFNRMALGVL